MHTSGTGPTVKSSMLPAVKYIKTCGLTTMMNPTNVIWVNGWSYEVRTVLSRDYASVSG